MLNTLTLVTLMSNVKFVKKKIYAKISCRSLFLRLGILFLQRFFCQWTLFTERLNDLLLSHLLSSMSLPCVFFEAIKLHPPTLNDSHLKQLIGLVLAVLICGINISPEAKNPHRWSYYDVRCYR